MRTIAKPGAEASESSGKDRASEKGRPDKGPPAGDRPSVGGTKDGTRDGARDKGQDKGKDQNQGKAKEKDKGQDKDSERSGDNGDQRKDRGDNQPERGARGDRKQSSGERGKDREPAGDPPKDREPAGDPPKDRTPAGDARKDRKPAGDGPKSDKPAGRESQPRSSADYSDKDLRATGRENWRSERDRHTRRAEREARADVKRATGKDAKVAGKGVEHHHHAGVKESKQVGLNPDVAGERERMTAVHSRKDDKVYGGEVRTDKDGKVTDTEVAKGDRRTHHNTAANMDKAEQARAAKDLGVKGDKASGDKPKLPASDAGRKAMTDASGTSKWRFPATGDQTERAKQDWKREPGGNATAEQSRRAKETWQRRQAEKPRASGDGQERRKAQGGQERRRSPGEGQERRNTQDGQERRKAQGGQERGTNRAGAAGRESRRPGRGEAERSGRGRQSRGADRSAREGQRAGGDAPRGTDAPRASNAGTRASKPRGWTDYVRDIRRGFAERGAPNRPSTDAAKRRPEGDEATARPRSEEPANRTRGDAPAAPRGSVAKGIGKVVDGFAKAGRVAGVTGAAVSVVGDVAQVIGKDFPDALPEGTRVELRRPMTDMPFMTEPSGYSVEKSNGQVIYRGPDGNPVSKEEAIRNSEWNPRGGPTVLGPA